MNRMKLSLWFVNLIKFDTETRFKAMAAQGKPERGIGILDKLDAHFSNHQE